MIGGSTSCSGSAREKPPLRSDDHCIGVRTPSRSPRWMLSPMPSLVAVVDDRRAGHRQQQRVDQLDAPAVALHQRRKTAADAEVQARAAVARIGVPQIVALLNRSPSRASAHRDCAGKSPTGWSRRDSGVCRMMSVIGKRSSLRDRHVDARHQREVERHVAFVFVAEILLHVFRPLVRLGEQHPVRVFGVDGRRGSS